jgi:hypothetical protein
VLAWNLRAGPAGCWEYAKKAVFLIFGKLPQFGTSSPRRQWSETMSDKLTLLKCCSKDAQQEKGAESILRAIIRGAADRAPIDALVEMGSVLARIRSDDLRSELERN